MTPRKAGRGEAGTPALRALVAAGVAHAVRPYEHDRAAASFGLEASEALDVDPRRVLKTLLAKTGLAQDHGLVVAVVPVAGQLDLKALAAAVGARRAVMADPELAERVTGYVVGGISPLGQRRELRTVVDTSVFEHETVLVSAGRRGLDVELAPGDLVTLTGAQVAPVSRP